MEKIRMLPDEAAAYIGCRYDKLMQMVRKKQLPHYRIGRKVLFTKEALDHWIEQQEKQSIQDDNGLSFKII